VHLDLQAVRAGGDAGQRDIRHVAPVSRGMAGVEHDGQVAVVLDHRDGVDVGGEACGGLEGDDAALAQDDLRVALRHDIFRRHQQLFDLAAEPALEQHGLLQFPHLEQQAVVLHVARADLQHVRVIRRGLAVVVVHDLGHHRQAGLLARLGEDLQALYAQSLEGVGRGARLEGAPAQHVCARRLHRVGDLQCLRAALHAARPGHDAQLRAAHRHPAEVEDRAGRMVRAAGQLVRLGHQRHALDVVEGGELVRQHHLFRADHADDGDDLALDARVDEGAQALRLDGGHHGMHGRVRRALFHNDNHDNPFPATGTMDPGTTL